MAQTLLFVGLPALLGVLLGHSFLEEVLHGPTVKDEQTRVRHKDDGCTLEYSETLYCPKGKLREICQKLT